MCVPAGFGLASGGLAVQHAGGVLAGSVKGRKERKLKKKKKRKKKKKKKKEKKKQKKQKGMINE